jgi:hypothetical protein
VSNTASRRRLILRAGEGTAGASPQHTAVTFERRFRNFWREKNAEEKQAEEKD